MTVALIDLEDQDRQEYYNGYANRTLWPLFHYLLDQVPLGSGDWDAYLTDPDGERINYDRDCDTLAQQMSWDVVARDYVVPGHDEILLRKTLGPLSQRKIKPPRITRMARIKKK